MVLPLFFVLDAVLVAVFATFGRGAHSEGVGAAQVWGTAWPFLIGLLVGWSALLVRRRDPATLRSGVVVWAVTLVGGMTVRGFGDGRVPHWSFILVAATATAVLLLGWRVARAAARRRAPRRPAPISAAAEPRRAARPGP